MSAPTVATANDPPPFSNAHGWRLTADVLLLALLELRRSTFRTWVAPTSFAKTVEYVERTTRSAELRRLLAGFRLSLERQDLAESIDALKAAFDHAQENCRRCAAPVESQGEARAA